MTQALMFNAIDMVVLVNPRDPELQGDVRSAAVNCLSYATGYTERPWPSRRVPALATRLHGYGGWDPSCPARGARL